MRTNKKGGDSYRIPSTFSGFMVAQRGLFVNCPPSGGVFS